MDAIISFLKYWRQHLFSAHVSCPHTSFFSMFIQDFHYEMEILYSFGDSFLGWMNVLFLRTKFLKCVQMMFAFLTFINLYSPLWTETLPAFFSSAMMNFKLKFVPPSFLIWCSFYLWYAFTCHEACLICISTTVMWYAKLNFACASTHNEFYYHVPSASCAHLTVTNGTEHHFIAIAARL